MKLWGVEGEITLRDRQRRVQAKVLRQRGNWQKRLRRNSRRRNQGTTGIEAKSTVF